LSAEELVVLFKLIGRAVSPDEVCQLITGEFFVSGPGFSLTV
jgi:hypothetical protein